MESMLRDGLRVIDWELGEFMESLGIAGFLYCER